MEKSKSVMGQHDGYSSQLTRPARLRVGTNWKRRHLSRLPPAGDGRGKSRLEPSTWSCRSEARIALLDSVEFPGRGRHHKPLEEGGGRARAARRSS